MPQVALLLSAESQRDKSDDVFTPYGTTDELEGTLHALLELHYSVDILAEHQLHDRLDHFPLLVIPNSHKLADEFKDRVIRYVRDGGSLLLLGPRCAALFSDLLGARLQGEPQPAEAELDTPAGLVNARGEWQSVEMTEAEAAGLRYQKRGLREDGEVSATIAGFGRGKVCAVYGPVALNYFRSHHPWLRRFIGSLVARIFESPAVMVEAPPCVDVSLRRTHEGHLSVHLANLAGVPLSGRHTVTDYIPPLGRLSVSLKCESEPASVTWQPEGSNLAWEWKEGTLTVHIDTLHIHGVVLIESGFSA